MSHSQAVYKFGDLVFLVVAHAAPAGGFRSEAYRLGDGQFELVIQRDDTPIGAAAPAAWQAAFRMVSTLETYLGRRGEEVRGFDINPYPYRGTWRLPG